MFRELYNLLPVAVLAIPIDFGLYAEGVTLLARHRKTRISDPSHLAVQISIGAGQQRQREHGDVSIISSTSSRGINAASHGSPAVARIRPL